MKFVFQIKENVYKDLFYLYVIFDNILFLLLLIFIIVFIRKTRYVVIDVWVIVGNVGYQLFLGVKVLVIFTIDYLGIFVDILVVAVYGLDGYEAAVVVWVGKVVQFVLMAVVFVIVQSLFCGIFYVIDIIFGKKNQSENKMDWLYCKF